MFWRYAELNQFWQWGHRLGDAPLMRAMIA
jgi:hypothetical protein